MTTPWPIDKQYPGPPEHGDTVRVRPPALYPPVPADPVAHWKAVLILSIGILSAFAAGVGIVWLWGRFVMACS